MRTTRLRGARTHNLKGVDLDIEPGTLLAIAGPSGAGKSSLAFKTLYAEGQRRYVESFSAYARQFLERLARPPVDELEPVPVAIAVDRQAPVRTSRSTVGTMTEVADYMKSLWAHVAELECPTCQVPVRRDEPAAIVEEIFGSAPDQRVVVTYPVPVADAESFVGVREELVADGYRRVFLNDATLDLDELRPSDVYDSKRFDVIADRAVARRRDRGRLVEALEVAMHRSGGRADVWLPGTGRFGYSRGLHCTTCEATFRDATPAMFSFNSPLGACAACKGFGRVIGVDWERVMPDASLSLAKGAIRAWKGKSAARERRRLARCAKQDGIPMDLPIGQFDERQQAWLLDGDSRGGKDDWYGMRAWFDWLETKAYKMHVRVFLARYRKYEVCPECHGARLNAGSRNWRVDGLTLPELFGLPASSATRFLEMRAASFEEDPAMRLLLSECLGRLKALEDVGLGYLSLDRTSRTLSGGEAQRVALTGALGASLNGAMFVLDEPTVGLHPRDVDKLLGVVQALAEDDNIVVIVEHSPAMLAGADRVVELGPGAGEHGGEVVFDGSPAALKKAKTATGRSLARKAKPRAQRREPTGWLRLEDATGHNLQGVTVELPLGVMCAVTGVSGSGKSSLVLETLLPALRRHKGDVSKAVGLPFARLEGADAVEAVVGVDQAPLGRTSRGNPATYLKLWDVVRKRFVAESLAKERGYKPGAFSFNVAGGRCEACKGEGAETVEMQFLADVTFSCPVCQGRRFVGPILDVKHRGLDVADVLGLTAVAAMQIFEGDKQVEKALAPLVDVGLGYLRLGQPLNTLSGGEAQRLKLAQALARATPGSLILLDEPTAGLHADDVAPLLAVLDRLVERGDTVVVVEHDMHVAAHADYVIDLGPGPGDEGGLIVVAGSPEEVAAHKASATAPFLAAALGAKAPRGAKKRARKKRGKGTRAMEIHGAREHNLRNVSIDIPRDQLVVVTGPSGSGKSTLAFDVLYAEGQRRYLETLSPYARQYMPQLPRPAVDKVAGIPPSVSLEQRITRGGRTSTVATVTEVAHYLRLSWARAGLLHCPDCGDAIAPRSAPELAKDLGKRYPGRGDVAILAPLVRGRKGHYREHLAKARKDGFTEALIDGELMTLVPKMKLERYQEHDIDLLVGRVGPRSKALVPLVERALGLGDGTAKALRGEELALLSSKRACPSCGTGFPELDPRFFSFNTRQGQCEPCEGTGFITKKVGPRRKKKVVSRDCDVCDQTRLGPLPRAVTLGGARFEDIVGLSVTAARDALEAIELDGREASIAKIPLTEAIRRLSFLDDVGLGYLGLDRSANTLSGGEMQRVRLAAQLGAGLTGVLYVLDEPTIGLHPRDTGRLLGVLRRLVDRGNSVLVVEHDADTILAADHLIDVGPGGGRGGGTIVGRGEPKKLVARGETITGKALSRPAPVPEQRRSVDGADWLRLSDARMHNLKGVDFAVPLGRLVAVTGVSGSGKSTLVREVFLRALREAIGLVTEPAGTHGGIEGFEAIERAVEIDQSPIGRTPRSVPATYVDAWGHIRKLLAGTPEARARGFGPSRFSFNVDQGRCPTCKGNGALHVEMAFLPDVHVPCDDCGGARFGPETLDILWRDKSAAELLDLEVREAVQVFETVTKVRRPFELLDALGLGYLRLGQASNTLSGGEAQRLKLVSELNVAGAGNALYVMDEPTTGLHRDDVARLIDVLHRFVDRGDTVVVIEHHPDVMLAADWLVDLGPEGGEGGGEIVVAGTPEQVAATKASHTGKVLRDELRRVP